MTERRPTPHDLVHELLQVLGRDGAYPQSPKAVWQGALQEVAAMRAELGEEP